MTANLDKAFGAMRATWYEMLCGGDHQANSASLQKRIEAITAVADSHWSSMERGAGRTCLWADQNEGTSINLSVCANRLFDMALAHETRGSALFRNPALLSDIASGLGFLQDSRYDRGKQQSGNWFDWEIAVPQFLGNTAVLLHDHLEAAQLARLCDAIDYYSPVVDKRRDANNSDKTDIFMGANRVWKCLVVGVRAVLAKDADKLRHASDGLGIVFETVEHANGFYHDGSFIQHHKHPSTGGYGKSLLESISDMLYLLGGSPWEVSHPGLADVWKWIDASFAPLLWRGGIMDMVRGREVARHAMQDHQAGHGVLKALARLAQVAPANKAPRIKSLVKTMVSADTYLDFFSHASVSTNLLVQSILNDPTVPRLDPPDFARVFGCMDRVVQQRPGWAFGVSLSSNRIYNYEGIMEENLEGWLQGDGMTFFYTADLSRYSDNFWPTVDPCRLSGVTADTREREPKADMRYESPAVWAGGCLLDGRYASAGMDFVAPGCTLTARKSWFCFDDEIVAVGSGITAQDGRAIITTVENSKLSPDYEACTLDGTPAPSTAWDLPVKSRMQLQNCAAWVLLQPATATARRETRSRSWSDINRNAKFTSTEVHSRDYASLVLDHGVNPHNASYAWALLPGATDQQAAAWQAAPPVEVLANNPELHAVWHQKLAILGLHCWSGPASLSQHGTTILETDAPVALWLCREAEGTRIAISDPTQTSQTITLTLHPGTMTGSWRDTARVSLPERLTARLQGSALVLTLNCAGLRGATVEGLLS